MAVTGVSVPSSLWLPGENGRKCPRALTQGLLGHCGFNPLGHHMEGGGMASRYGTERRRLLAHPKFKLQPTNQ